MTWAIPLRRLLALLAEREPQCWHRWPLPAWHMTAPFAVVAELRTLAFPLARAANWTSLFGSSVPTRGSSLCMDSPQHKPVRYCRCLAPCRRRIKCDVAHDPGMPGKGCCRDPIGHAQSSKPRGGCLSGCAGTPTNHPLGDMEAELTNDIPGQSSIRAYAVHGNTSSTTGVDDMWLMLLWGSFSRWRLRYISAGLRLRWRLQLATERTTICID
jgi:hypothetical protein